MIRLLTIILAILLALPLSGQYKESPSDNSTAQSIFENDADTVKVKKNKKKKKEVITNEKGEIIKTGFNFGPLPAIAYDADKGFQLGALLNIFDFGNGSTYPNPRQQFYIEGSFYTKGSQFYTIWYDTKFLIPNTRFSTALTVINDKGLDFYGFNGYNSFYDHQRVSDSKKNDDTYLYTPFYKVNRLSVLYKADFIGNIWNKKLFWEAGYHLNWTKEGAIDRVKINKGKKEEKKFPDSEPTLFEQYRKWGIIPDNEADGGLVSALRLGLLFDTRDKEAAPSKGIWAEGHMILAPKFIGTKNPFYRYSITFRHYVPIVKNDILTFAYRLNYEGTIGNSAPYYVLPYLTVMGQSYDRDGMGGFRTVRGIMRNRIQGLDVGIYNVELRYRFVKFKLWKQNIAFAVNAFSDGAIATRYYDMSFKKTESDFNTPEDYQTALSEYNTYLSKGSKEGLHATIGGGIRFIMNQNFIVCVEYGTPIGKNRKQDGPGALYVNIGYLF